MVDKPKKPAKEPSPKLKEKRYSGLRPWKPGEVQNPGGRPRQHKEMVQKLRENADFVTDTILALIEKGITGKLTTSDKILSQHLWETWQAMFGRHPQSVLLAGGVDVGDTPVAADGTGALTALLAAARKAPLVEGERKAAEEAKRAEAEALTAAEQEISPLAIMLAQVRLDTPDGSCATECEVLEFDRRQGPRRRADRQAGAGCHRGRLRRPCRRAARQVLAG